MNTSRYICFCVPKWELTLIMYNNSLVISLLEIVVYIIQTNHIKNLDMWNKYQRQTVTKQYQESTISNYVYRIPTNNCLPSSAKNNLWMGDRIYLQSTIKWAIQRGYMKLASYSLKELLLLCKIWSSTEVMCDQPSSYMTTWLIYGFLSW